MRELLLSLLVWVLAVEGQNFPLFRHTSTTGTTNFSNNSFIARGVISGNAPLECVTDHTPCCLGEEGGWTDPAGVAVREGSTGATTFYVTRTGMGAINLNRFAQTDSSQLSGMYQCQIRVSSEQLQILFIYLGVGTTGE